MSVPVKCYVPGRTGNGPVDCPGILVHVDEDYGSLGSGGSYDIYQCNVCGRRSYSPMAD